MNSSNLITLLVSALHCYEMESVSFWSCRDRIIKSALLREVLLNSMSIVSKILYISTFTSSYLTLISSRVFLF